MVVGKQQFLKHYHISPEAGRVTSYQEFFNTSRQPHAYVNVNQLGTRCYLSHESADSTINLYMSDNIDNSWSAPHPLRGISETEAFQKVNYPYMMGDGQTFYFAAVSEEGLGGYDIYVTRYDTEENRFLHPANIGMPFNSEGNDYMYVIDEYNNLGWFATDRSQTEDSVCIYVFIPPATRRTYSAAGLSMEDIESYARIDRIADTWTDSTALADARQRLASIRTPQAHDSESTADFHFVINDNLTYTRLSDFKAPGTPRQYQQLFTLQRQYQRLRSALGKARDYYATASREEREEIGPEILASEQRQHELYLEIRRLEKNIRNEENIFLTNNK